MIVPATPKRVFLPIEEATEVPEDGMETTLEVIDI